MKIMQVILYIIVSSLIIGCSSIPRYPNTQPKNITINMTLGENDRGGLFTSVEVAAGINDLDNKCETHYQGYIDLAQGENKLGLIPDQLTYLLIEIYRGRYGSSSSFSRGTLMKPKKGMQYEIDFNYVDSMFDLRLYEINKSKKKELELIPLSACRPSK